VKYPKEFKKVIAGWKVKTAYANWKQEGGKVESIYETGYMPVLVYSGLFNDEVIEIDIRFFKKEGKWADCRISATNPELNGVKYDKNTISHQDIINGGILKFFMGSMPAR
jgi:hypothetical protein